MLRDPYRFIGSTCDSLGSKCFATRLFGAPAVCLSGAEAAKIFYDPQLTYRKGAAPEPIRATLFGKGGIQSADGLFHRERKALFMSFMTPERIHELQKSFTQEMKHRVSSWRQRKVHLYKELQQVITKIACEWTGVPLKATEVQQRSNDLTAMFDSAAAFGMGHFRSRRARRRCETWIAQLILEHRYSKSPLILSGPAHAIAEFRKSSGLMYSAHEASVEILNLIRPLVAVSVYILFVVHAFNQYPVWKEKIFSGPQYLEWFVQEIRRFYPFFPAIIAKAKTDFAFDGYTIPKDTRLFLDVYGTNHDSLAWDFPDEFNPERFATTPLSEFNSIPQGGADQATNHRCPGEQITLALMMSAAELFALEMKYEVPEQNLKIDFTRLPAIPKSGLVISHAEIRRKKPSANFQPEVSPYY